METVLAGLDSLNPPRLLLHACCAPCSSAVLESLSRFFRVGLLYYNPNIAPQAEYDRRARELERLVAQMPLSNPVALLPVEYDGEAFTQAVRGLEGEPEGGARCLECFRLRLGKAAAEARRLGYDYFTTTLSISPLKDAAALNRLGEAAGKAAGVAHLPADFKKKGGYQRSIELSREYGLYRQDYCGCVFSKAERERKKEMGRRAAQELEQRETELEQERKDTSGDHA